MAEGEGLLSGGVWVWLAQYNEGGYSGVDLISVNMTAEGAKRACEGLAQRQLVWELEDDEDDPWYKSWVSGKWTVTKTGVLA